MVRERRGAIVEILRQRIHRALQLRALRPGDRLPTTREIASELRADPRVVADAYRTLANEGLVELRARSGVFVSQTLQLVRARPAPSRQWLVEVFAAGVARGVPIPQLPRVLSAAIRDRDVRVTVVATTIDQTEGICRELREDFGFASRGVLAELIDPHAALPTAIRRAELLITTEAHEKTIGSIAARLAIPVVCIAIRTDLYDAEWSLFRDRDAYVLVADPRFGRIVHRYLETIGADSTVHIVVAGEDSLSEIPPDAPVYATQAARSRIGATRLPAGLLPPVRFIADDCAREIINQILLLQR